MAKGYTTIPLIEAYMLITIEDYFEPNVTEFIEQAEAHIESMTGRTFITAVPDGEDSGDQPEPEERVFDGHGGSQVIIDDLVELVSVSTGFGDDSELLDADSYILGPNNKLPKTHIRMLAGGFPNYPQSVTVDGYWGYSVTCPKDITTVATVLVAGMISYALQTEAEVQSMSIGRYSVTYKTKKEWQDFERIKETLDRYRKFTF